ncbi:MAG: polysaccharide biosynthesis C-terminal domain-containing protein [Bacteroidetes bacterium]|nr:polysaccharide biosynthesis C-terminal domain-containing protein [Bacteroidota bacterium]
MEQTERVSPVFVISFSEAWFWSVLVLPFLAFIHYYSSVLRAMHRIKISLIPFYVLLPVMVSMISYLCYRFNQEKLNVDAALMIYFFCVVIVFLFISRRLRMELKEQVTEAVPDYERKKWFSVSVTLLVISLFTLVLKKIDVLFISNYFGNTHAGIYAAASMISGFVPFGLIVVDYVFAPRISELYESRQMEKLQGMIRNTSRLIVLITLPIALVILVFGKLILQVFGTAFIASYLPLIILTAGQLVNAFTGMVAAMMTMTGNQKTFLLVLVISGMLDVALNMILVPSMGMTGGAIASAGSLIFLNLVLYFIVKKKLRIRISAFIF